MNDNEAKFLLRAYRPDNRDAHDPLFADALAQAEKNPEIREWLEREQAFDRAMAGKLREVQPPAGLRDAILAGGRASVQRRVWWKNPLWLAAAASIAVTLSISLGLRHTGPSAHEFAEFALHELATSHDQHDGGGPEYGKLQASLATTPLPLSGHAPFDAAELHRAHCHTLQFAGQEVFEICFERDGKWFHLYATPVGVLSAGTAVAQSLVTTKGSFTATAWKDAQFAYALVTDEGAEALRRLL